MRQSTGKYIKELSQFLTDSRNITLICHTNPDGDAIGSVLAMHHYLSDRGKSCKIVSPSALPDFLSWMDGASEICIYEEDREASLESLKWADLILLQDFNSLSRLGSLQDELKNIETNMILLDHHPGPDVPADLIISEPLFSSTSELVFDLVSHIEGRDYLESKFIEAVYVGMMTDTGNFSFGSYDGDTMRIVGSMLESGLPKDFISDRVYDNFSADRMRLKGFALAERMMVIEELNTAYIYLTRSDLERFNHSVGDTEGFVNMPLSIRGIKMSVLFIEKNDHVKLSLRSKGEFSVNELSRQYFNGGGHKNAAGGRLDMTMERSLEFFESVIQELKDSLK